MSSGGMPGRARYIMTGGFLGAGKTTSLNRFAAWLTAQGLRVGLITNDQGRGLTDSAIGRASAYPVEEIGGGCFCCRFSSLLEAAQNLTGRDRPDVFLAEPVGSCTDLTATVSLPLQHLYGDRFAVAPLAVVIDPLRALRVLGLGEGRAFSEGVLYIYRKQLEEAEVLVINKADLLTPEQLTLLQDALTTACPGAQQYLISARDGTGMEPWFQHMMTREMDVRHTMAVDYERYGEGEALLGWLNAAVSLTSANDDEWDGNAFLPALALEIRRHAAAAGIEIAHLKMTLNPPGDALELAAVNLVATGRQPELSHHLSEPLEAGDLLLNLRAEGDPDALHAAVEQALATTATAAGLRCDIREMKHFRPGMPQPEHRMTLA